MSIKIRKDGQVGELILSADSIQVLDIEGRFNSKNLEDVLKEVSSGTETNMTRIENKVEQLSNPNLLINGDFQVWTKGTEFTDPREYNGECANRWFWNYSVVQGSKINKVDGGLKITYLKDCTTALIYKMSFEDKKSLLGKQLTVSFELNGTKYQKSFTLKNLRESLVFETDFEIYTGYNEDSNDVVYLNPKRKQGTELIVKNVKLEIGDTVTPFDHKPYSVELENSIKYDVNGNYKQIYSNPNLLINGDFQVWQRGTTFNALSVVDSKYTVDRWRTYAYNANCPTISKHEKGWRVQGSNGFNLLFSQTIEEDQLKSLYGKALTLSVEYEILKGNITVSAAIRTDSPRYNMGAGANRIETPSVNQGNNKIGVLKTTLSSFKEGYKTLMPVIYIDNTNGGDSDLIIKNVKLELGTVATPFVPRPYSQELADCQRYYFRNQLLTLRSAICTVDQLRTCAYNFPVKMRVAPTIRAIVSQPVNQICTPAYTKNITSPMTSMISPKDIVIYNSGMCDFQFTINSTNIPKDDYTLEIKDNAYEFDAEIH